MKIIKGGSAKKYLKVLAYGKPGVGKTRLASTAKNPLVFDLEHGLGEYNFDRLQAKSIEQLSSDLEEIIKKVKSGEYKYDTIVIDSLTALRQFETTKKKKFLRDDWGTLKRDATKLMDLIRDIPLHVICTAHTSTDEQNKISDDGQLYSDDYTYVPQISGSMKEALPGFFDVVVYLYKGFDKEGKIMYLFDVDGRKNNVSKTRYSNITNNSNLNFSERVDIVNNAEKSKGKEKVISEVKSDYDKLTIDYKELMKLSGFTNKESGEKIYESMKLIYKDNKKVEELKSAMATSGKFNKEQLSAAVDYIDMIVENFNS